MNQLTFITAIVACFIGGELLLRLRAPGEVARKFVHVTACIVIAGYRSFGLSMADLVPMAATFTVLLAVTRSMRLLPALSSVGRDSWGEVFLPLSALILAWLDIDPHHFSVAFLILGIADAAASLVGQSIRSPGYMVIRSRKTLAGSLAFLLCAWLVLSFAVTGSFWPSHPPVAATLAIVAVLLMMGEGLGHAGSDNLIVPVASAALLAVVFSPWWPITLPTATVDLALVGPVSGIK